jgi:hypothetical protein
MLFGSQCGFDREGFCGWGLAAVLFHHWEAVGGRGRAPLDLCACGTVFTVGDQIGRGARPSVCLQVVFQAGGLEVKRGPVDSDEEAVGRDDPEQRRKL